MTTELKQFDSQEEHHKAYNQLRSQIMASGSKKSIKVEGTFETLTKNGKARFGLEGTGVTGTIYMTPKAYKDAGEPEDLSFTVAVAAAEE